MTGPRDPRPPGGEPIDAGLAAAQEALVRAMAAGGPLPEGFDAGAVGAAARSILSKRAGDVARAWPELARSYGTGWTRTFAGWAAGRPTRGSIRDAWDFARAHRDELSPGAVRELAFTEARWSYDGRSDPRRRRFAVRRVPGGVLVQVLGRIRVFGPAASG
ncbi:hypothetical protein GCM10023085_79880 [Actinomadura viridis]|uniref:SCO6045-like C-terminal domain-containing protein n=1 Tax=Actinomadura viridis TaxID=58110 RepID=A0A931GQ97_9ACTN|nr:hypothetical protein [Actinomadura viridis]MBG6088279.1 hypothetical protein [Actinomadura viridis]